MCTVVMSQLLKVHYSFITIMHDTLYVIHTIIQDDSGYITNEWFILLHNNTNSEK